MHRSSPTRILAVSVFLLCSRLASGQNTCPAANPNDLNSDDAALQSCLNGGGVIALSPNGYYRLAGGIEITVQGTTLTSQGPGKAKLVAMTELDNTMLQVNWVNNVTISEVRFDGTKSTRNGQNSCADYRGWASNIIMRGDNLTIHHIESVNALCGTALEVEGNNLQIYSNYIADNGFTEGSRAGEPWSDGLTVHKCGPGSHIHDNTFANNTDIDLTVGGGSGCWIDHNTVTHDARYGFAGFHVGWFPPGAGNHASSTYEYNTVTASSNKLAFGVMIGYHPWYDQTTLPYAGVTRNNTATGAVSNLVVDGISSGTVTGNTKSGNQGTNGFANCTRSDNYSAADYGSASIQTGAVYRVHHSSLGGCAP